MDIGTEATTRREVDWTAVMETALNSPGQLGTTYNRFHNYSFLNTILLLSQGARGPVASYKRWHDLGRQVMKGERGYEIVRPITVKREDENGEPETFTRFKVVRGAFTYSQTSGEELPEPDLPAWDFKRALGKLAITEVPFEAIDGNAQGYAYQMKIAVNPAAVYPVKTRLHEMAHCVLGHTTRPRVKVGDPVDELERDRGIRELEAEGTAYLTLTELGLSEFFNPAESRGYIQHWLDKREAPVKSIRAIFKATQLILSAGYPEAAALSTPKPHLAA